MEVVERVGRDGVGEVGREPGFDETTPQRPGTYQPPISARFVRTVPFAATQKVGANLGGRDVAPDAR